jgi:hypothetical protein
MNSLKSTRRWGLAGLLLAAATLLPACTTKAVVRRLGAASSVSEESIPTSEVLRAGLQGQLLLLRVFYPLGPDRPSGRHDLGEGTTLSWVVDLSGSEPLVARKATVDERKLGFEPVHVGQTGARGKGWVAKTPSGGVGSAQVSVALGPKRWTVEIPDLPGDYWELSVGARLGLVLSVPFAFVWDVVTFPIQAVFD